MWIISLLESSTIHAAFTILFGLVLLCWYFAVHVCCVIVLLYAVRSFLAVCSIGVSSMVVERKCNSWMKLVTHREVNQPMYAFI